VKYLVGELLNNLSRPNVVLAMTPTSQGSFKPQNLVDGFVEKYAKWSPVTGGGGDGGADDRRILTANQSVLRNGGFEQGLVGWVKTGTVTVVSSPTHSGTKALQVAAGGTNRAVQDLFAAGGKGKKGGGGAGYFLSGEWARIQGWLLGSAGATAQAYLQDVLTGRFLQPGGLSWGAEAPFATNADAAYVEGAVSFRCEPYSLTQSHLTKLRIILKGAGSGNVVFDDFVIYPGLDWLSIHGFNFAAVMAPRLWGSHTGAFAGEETLLLSLTPRQPAFYGVLPSVVFYQHLMFELQGFVDPAFQPAIGELVAGQAQTLLVGSQIGAGVSNEFPATAKGGGSGKKGGSARKTALKTAVQPVRTLTLPFVHPNTAAYDQHREWFVLRCRGEGEDIVFAPDSMDAGEVVYGGLVGARGHTLLVPDPADASLRARQGVALKIKEDPFPRF